MKEIRITVPPHQIHPSETNIMLSASTKGLDSPPSFIIGLRNSPYTVSKILIGTYVPTFKEKSNKNML